MALQFSSTNANPVGRTSTSIRVESAESSRRMLDNDKEERTATSANLAACMNASPAGTKAADGLLPPIHVFQVTRSPAATT